MDGRIFHNGSKAEKKSISVSETLFSAITFGLCSSALCVHFDPPRRGRNTRTHFKVNFLLVWSLEVQLSSGQWCILLFFWSKVKVGDIIDVDSVVVRDSSGKGGVETTRRGRVIVKEIGEVTTKKGRWRVTLLRHKNFSNNYQNSKETSSWNLYDNSTTLWTPKWNNAEG